MSNAFVQDDIPVLTEDSRMVDLSAWPRFFVEPYWPPPYAADQYRPLTSVVLSLEYITGAGSPTVVRICTYVLYALVCVLVLGLSGRALPHRAGASLLAAAVFAAHPVHVEATALGVGQAELLVAMFTVLAVNRYIDARRRGDVGTRDWLILCGCYIGATLSKEQGFLLPAFLLISEGLLMPPEHNQRNRSLWIGYAALAVVGLLLAGARLGVLGSAAPRNIAEALQGLEVAPRALTALRLVPEWLRLLTWPVHLRVDYSPQEFTASSGFGTIEMLGAALLLLLIAGAWIARHRAPAVTFGVTWLALALLPVSNVVVPTGVLVAERTLLLPTVGWVIAASAALAAGARHLRFSRRLAMVMAGVVVLAGVIKSSLRQREFLDNDTLTRAAIRDSPRSWRANANHADLLFREGQVMDARAAYARAIALAPSPWWVRHDYARRLYGMGDYDAALAELATSLAEFPDQPVVLRDAIATLLTLGRYVEARGVAIRVMNSGRESPEIIRLARLADSALTVGAPAGSVRIDISSSPVRQ